MSTAASRQGRAVPLLPDGVRVLLPAATLLALRSDGGGALGAVRGGG
jgi:hypothetical protein